MGKVRSKLRAISRSISTGHKGQLVSGDGGGGGGTAIVSIVLSGGGREGRSGRGRMVEATTMDIESIALHQRYLFVRKDRHPAAHAQLAKVGPGVARHPLAVALVASILAEASLLALVRGET